MANTLSNRTFRDELRSTTMQEILHSATVTEAIADVDRSGRKVIQNPYPSTPSVVIQALAGTYTPATFTTTDDALTVSQEIILSEHVYDFEESLSSFDLFQNRVENMAWKAKDKLDTYVLSTVLGTSSIGTLAVTGGFASFGVLKALGQLQGLVAGYSTSQSDVFLVIESTDVAAFIAAQVSNGFNMADMALKNGFMGNYLGVDVYVVRSGQSPSNHRLAGIKRKFTVALPVEWKQEEKGVSGLTGKEIVMYGYTGVKVWNNNLPLIIDVQIA
jgi:hypothetical protein